MNRLIIGVPHLNDLECLKAMLISLNNSTSCHDGIIVLDGGSTEYVLEELRKIKGVELIEEKFKTPLEAYNYLFNIAKTLKSDLFLTQTDVIFPYLYKRDWLEIMRLAAQDENVGAITCLNGGGISGPDYVNGFRWLGGWCSYYPLRTLKKIGGYDENFPNGYGVDIDHTFRIYQAGLKILYMDYWVDHHQMNSRKHDNDPKSEEAKKESSYYFKLKYGLMARSEDDVKLD